jgi:ubiquinol-cytochrome c reductase subunit 8
VWWGDYHHGLQKQRGVVTYSKSVSLNLLTRDLGAKQGVSPFRQSATSHLFRSYLFNGYRRLSAQLPYWLIPVGIGVSIVLYFVPSLTEDMKFSGYSVYAWAKKRDAWQNSKAGHLAGASH